MGLPFYDYESRRRIEAGIVWTETQRGLTSAEPLPAHPDQQVLRPIRGYLLQNVYGNGTGAMQLAYRSQSKYASLLAIIGTNFVANSQFKLLVSGTSTSGSPSGGELFTTQAIDVESTADELKTKLLLAAQAASLPVNGNDISVSLGNPMSSANLIIPPEGPPPEITVSPPDDPKSYVGVWLINFTGALARQYSEITVEVVQDTSAFMRGLSTVISRPVVDLPGTVIKPVFDVMNRPIDYPWMAGSLCGAINYPDLGYGIIWSDFRNQTIELPTASS